MKDQFGNYVVQKVLETCDDHSREIILSRIKVHLNALKRYTYGKHIVSRVEKLVTAGGENPFLFNKSSSYNCSIRFPLPTKILLYLQKGTLRCLLLIRREAFQARE